VLLPAAVIAARSVCWVPDGVGGELVHKLKYGGWTGVAVDLAERMARLARPCVAGVESVVVPVPLGTGRRRERGYNQSAELARALAARWKLVCVENALARVRETVSQVRLTHDERSANVHSAFGAGPAAGAIRGRHVIVIDDVVTTAATLNACAAAALAAGAHTISYVTFGRARAAFDRRPHARSEPRWQSVSASMASAALAAKSSAPPKSGASKTSTSLRSTT
jgi:ComF family protein